MIPPTSRRQRRRPRSAETAGSCSAARAAAAGRADVRGGHGIEKEAPRGGVVARELSDLEHGSGGDRFTAARDDEGRQRGLRVERTGDARDGSERDRLVGRIEDVDEEIAVREAFGEDEPKLVDAAAASEGIRDRRALGRELGKRRRAEGIRDSRANRVGAFDASTRGVAIDGGSRAGCKISPRGLAGRAPIPVPEHEARRRARII